MRRYALLSFTLITLIAGGCGEKNTPTESAVPERIGEKNYKKPEENGKEALCGATIKRQCDIIEANFENRTWLEGDFDIIGDDVIAYSGATPFDLDGDGIKEILIHVNLDRASNGYWWLQYYKDGAWHKASDAYFMWVADWEIYTRKDDDMNLPRMFRKEIQSQLVSAVVFDREKSTVTLEPFDYKAFLDLNEKGLLRYSEWLDKEDKAIPNADSVGRQFAIAMSELEHDGREHFNSYAMPFDFDGYGTTEILTKTQLSQHEKGEWRVRYFYRNGAWREGPSTVFMRANGEDLYVWGDGRRLYAWLVHDGATGTVSKLVFDRRTGTVFLKPFDTQEFQSLLEKGSIKCCMDFAQE